MSTHVRSSISSLSTLLSTYLQLTFSEFLVNLLLVSLGLITENIWVSTRAVGTYMYIACVKTMCGSRGGTWGSDPPLKNYKNIGFLGDTGPDPLKKHKATKPAFKVGPPAARQRNAIIGTPAKRHLNGVSLAGR